MKENNKKTCLTIIKWVNNPILREKSAEIEYIDAKLQDFAIDLLDTMWEKDWVWLAAPQVGKNIRMIAITQWKTKWKKIELKWEEIMINPKYLFKSKETQIDEEWCLSIPWITWKVERHSSIKIEYTDINWITHIHKAEWMNARIIQHEMDHLDWILFTDKQIKQEKKIDLSKSLFIKNQTSN